MSKRKSAALIAYLPTFRDRGFVAGRWSGGGEVGPNTFQMPSVEYDEAVQKFAQTAYDEKIVVDFNWPEWIDTEEASRLRNDPSYLATANFDQLSKLLTVIIRQDRFAEGSLLEAFNSGLVLGILERAEALAGEGSSRRSKAITLSRRAKSAESSSNILSVRFDQALAFAASLHREQTRKGTSIPYISHLLAVCGIVLEHGGDENAAIGALLHDAAEDQGGQPTLDLISHMYGDAVAQIVADCTDAWTEPKPDWRPRKEAYIASLDHKAARSLLVSLADKVHNVRAISSDYRQMGEALWSRFTGGRETLWYYGALADAFTRKLPGRLAAEFQRDVDELKRMST